MSIIPDDDELRRGRLRAMNRPTQTFEKCRWCDNNWHGLPKSFQNNMRLCLGSHQDQPPQRIPETST